MSLDPVTVKIIAQTALKVATDEETRRRVLILILAPIIGFLLLIALILYLLTSPFSVLSQWLVGDEITTVQDFQVDYGYNQSLGIYENDYLESQGKDYSDLTFTDGSTEVIYYNQVDIRWKDELYGQSGTVGTSGCGPTALAMVVSSLTDTMISPKEMADWSYENGYRCPGNGSYHSLIPNGAETFGLSVESISVDDPQKLIDALSSGKLVIALMAKGHFTSGGHFIVLRGVTNDGKILVADPASVDRSEKEWDLSIILDEARHGASAGGPLWAIY